MGKTPKPLKLLVHPDLWDLEEFVKLREQGHPMDKMPPPMLVGDALGYVLVLGPNCWWMPKDLTKYLSEALKQARKVVYGDRTKVSKPKARKKKSTT